MPWSEKLRSPGFRVILVLLVVVGAVPAMTCPVWAEMSIAVYTGRSSTENSDLHFRQGNTDLHFSNVRWTDHSFENPLYYGARLSYWPETLGGWGASLDFTHAKIFLAETDQVMVEGARNGQPVYAREPIANSINSFAMSHGLNMLTLNGMYRWSPAGVRDQSLAGRMQIYGGLGGGISIPHVEADIGGKVTGKYQFAAGPVVDGMAGLNYDLTDFLSLFLEYKLSYADIHAKLDGGGSMDLNALTHQFIVGLSANIKGW